jgi:hypothetical protein
MHQNYHFIVMLSQMLLHDSARQRHLRGAHTILKSYVSMYITKNKGISSEVVPISSFGLLMKWKWLTVAGSSRLLWNTAHLGPCSTQ